MKFKSKNGFSTAVFEVDPNLEATPSLDFCGRFLKLQTLNSPYLANYVEFTRLASDSSKIALTTEHPRGMPLSAVLPSLNQKEKYEITFHLLSALRYLHSEGVTVGHLLPQNIIVDVSSRSCSIKLIHYGSLYLFGRNIFDDIYNIFTLTPERIMKIRASQKASDLFALGILLVCIQMETDIHSEYTFSKYWQSLTSILLQLSDPFCDTSIGDKLDILFQNVYDSQNQSKDSTIHSAIRNLLKINPSQRPHLTTVLSLFDPKPKQPIISNDFPADIQLHLWKLCGKSIERNLIESKFIHVSASVVMLSYGHPISRFIIINDKDKKHVKTHYKIFIQPDDNFHEAGRAAKEYLDHKNILRYRSGCNEFERCRSAMTFTSQFERFVAFYEDVYHGRKALSADTPNSIRAKIWARRLIPKGLPNYLFYVSNNSLAKSCKHQLSLDLPRCHQYDESMTSAQIQSKVTALIEKILAVSPDSSAYWQGLDSLIAPFAILYANDLENGFGVVFEIIQRFTPEYFTRLSSHALEESLRTFSRLISYANSRLACFLRVNGLSPSTYAVPWLLTCYAHVFAFDKLFRIFDRMLDRDASYPLAIGISILEICAIDLMDAVRGDEAFKVLSNVSDIDITKLLTYSDRFNENIPATCYYRKHAEPPHRAPNLTVKYSEAEDNELLVPKIHPDDFYQYFGRNDAILVVCNGESTHPQIVSIPLNGFNESFENIVRKKQEDNKVIGIISNDEQLSIKTANELTDCSIDRVCVVDSSWLSFQWNHNL
uniref:TBC domain-containing protein kinase-like protein n=1 Tax=Panagrolaimus sp. ES5 TaxID=591445 RepID=A0AC34GU63_9BILA